MRSLRVAFTIAVGVGWSEPEYRALGRDFRDRGARLDEAIDLFRKAWSEDPFSFHGPFTSFDDLRLFPKPEPPDPHLDRGEQ